MAGKKPSSETPPPLDPFPTYQSSYPRPSSTEMEENPFIAFRRFADSQISSLLSSVTGLPSLFAQSPATGRFADIENEMTRRRQELEEGWRKQWEQEREEGKQEWEMAKNDLGRWPNLSSDRRESKLDGAARSEDLTSVNEFMSGIVKMIENIERPLSQEFQRIMKEMDDKPSTKAPGQTQNRKCPALQDASTELDLYESSFKRAMEKDKKQQSRYKRDGFDRRADGWLSGVGWDGKQKCKSKGQKKTGDDTEGLSEHTTTHTFRTTRRFDPVSNPDHTLPWLLTSPYSPVYISNPNQPRLAKVEIIDEPMVPFRIFSPLFAERFKHPVAEELARKLSWADAFEDLVSLEQTGKMVDRDHSTWRTPSTWIHDMVARGSLGPRWGFDEQQQLVKKDLVMQGDSGDTWPSADAVQSAMKRVQDTQTEGAASVKSGDEIRSPITSDKAKDGLPRGWEKKEAKDGRLYYADHNTRTTTWNRPSPQMEEKESSTDQELVQGQVPETLSTSDSSTVWSTSASSWSSASGDNPDTVISTLTTTESRTLPDGSVEMKKVLKKRFADGREESNESVEFKNAPTSTSKSKAAVQHAPRDSQILKEVERLQEDKHTQTPSQPQEQPRKGGWFWI